GRLLGVFLVRRKTFPEPCFQLEPLLEGVCMAVSNWKHPVRRYSACSCAGNLPAVVYPLGRLVCCGLPTCGLPTCGLSTCGLPTCGLPTCGLPTCGLSTWSAVCGKLVSGHAGGAWYTCARHGIDS